MLRWSTRKKIVSGALAGAVVLLDVYALCFASQITFLMLFCIGLAAGLFWVLMGFSLTRGWRAFASGAATVAVCAIVLPAFLGAYTLFNSAYRAEIASEKESLRRSDVLNQETVAKVSEFMKDIHLYDGCSVAYRTGKMLPVIHSEDRTDVYDIELDNGTGDFDKSGTIVWISETSSTVGRYQLNVLGIDTGINSGDAVMIIWKVWLIDKERRTVTAYHVFRGAVPTSIEGVSAFPKGIRPYEDTVAWLNSLPEAPAEDE